MTSKEEKKSFLSILFVIAIDNFGLALVFVMFAPLIFSSHYHLVPAEASMTLRNTYLAILFASFPLMQLFGAPILGDIADQIGRKKALYISITGVIIGFLLSGFATQIWSFWLLVFARLFTGFFAGNLGICLSAIADLSNTEKKRSRNFGIVTVIWALSWNIAMFVGGYLSDPTKSSWFSPSLPFWLTALLTLLSALAVAKYFQETHQPDKKAPLDLIKGLHNIKAALKIPAIRPYFIVIIFWTLGWGLAVQWFGTYAILKYKVTQETITWGLFIQGITWTIGGSIINPLLLKKLDALPIAIIGYLLCTLFLIATALSPTYFSFCIFLWTSAIFAPFAFSNTMTLASIHAPEVVQGKVMGLSQSMGSFAWVIVPIMGGITGAKNTGFFYPIAALLMAVGLTLLFFEHRKQRA